MLTGISTACLYPMLTEDALAALCSQGVEAVEVFTNCAFEATPRMSKQLREIADAYGVKILSLHPHTGPSEPITFFSRYQRRFDEGVELYKKYYEAANILGARLVVFHGGSKLMPLTYDEYFEKFAVLVEDAIKSGSMLCHENVERCTGRSPEFFVKLSKAIPDARFVFDIKQAVRADEDVFKFADTLGEKIAHVHFSDNDSANHCLLPGNGTFNTEKFLKLLRKNGFNGGVIVELYRENFGGIVELLSGYQHVYTRVSTIRKNAETVDCIRQNE